MDIKNLGAKIKKVRESKNLTIDDVVSQTGLSQANYRRIENGEVTPRIDTMKSIASVLSVSIDALCETDFPEIEIGSLKLKLDVSLTKEQEAVVRRMLEIIVEYFIKQ